MANPNNHAAPAVNQPREARFARNLRNAFAEGRELCGIPAHFQVRTWQVGEQRMVDVERKGLWLLYSNMMPGETAKCPCLKAACEAQWRHNFHGSYTTTAITPGSYTKGIDLKSLTPKKVYSLNCTPNGDALKYLITVFPEWFFVCFRSATHDHPVAHTSTRIAGERLMDARVRGTVMFPKIYVDLNGNPSANERYMARNPGIKIISVVELITPKDHVRRLTKWGSRLDADGYPRWIVASLRDIGLGNCDELQGITIDGFISIHTLYYYDMAEIIRALNRHDCPLFAAHHRFEGGSGTMNNGEQSWVKRERSGEMYIYQTTTKTGSIYNHPDNSKWFDHDSAVYGEDGVGWDHNLLADEIFYTMVVPCPRVQCEMSESCLSHAGTLPRDKLSRSQNVKASSQADISRSNEVVLVVNNDVMCTAPIETHHINFFGEMRKTCIGKARTHAQYIDHVTRCKIRASSLEKSTSFRVDAQQLDEIARFSFFIDFDDQHCQDKVVFTAAHSQIVAANSIGRSGDFVKIAVKGMHVLLQALLSVSDLHPTTAHLGRAARAGLKEMRGRQLLQ